MGERRTYEMSEDQLATIIDASKPVPYVVMGGVEPASPQENANRAWKALAVEMGFKWDTVQPVPGAAQTVFTAEAV